VSREAGGQEIAELAALADVPLAPESRAALQPGVGGLPEFVPRELVDEQLDLLATVFRVPVVGAYRGAEPR
jgi:hypothetical protein